MTSDSICAKTTQRIEEQRAHHHAEADGILAARAYRAPTVMVAAVRAPTVMVAAVRALPAHLRVAAIKMAEAVLLDRLSRLQSCDDYSRNTTFALAAEAAAAEITFHFRPAR